MFKFLKTFVQEKIIREIVRGFTSRITVKSGNMLESIETESLDGIMNAANGRGPMGGGIAGAIRKYGGKEIQEDAIKVCDEKDPQPGEAYSTIPGSLKVKRIIHAVSMKEPGGVTSYTFITNAFHSALKLAIAEGITKIGCTALGTGVGGLDSQIVANKMLTIAKRYSKKIAIVFMDFDNSFVKQIRSGL